MFYLSLYILYFLYMLKDDRVPTFSPQIDRMLGGGIKKGAGLGLYGALGLGKTILAMQIAYSNISNSKTCSFHTHDQSADMLLYKMKSFGWDPEPYMDNFHILDFYSHVAITEEALEDPSASLEEFLSKKMDLMSLLKWSNEEMKKYLGGFPDLLIVDSATPFLMQLGGRKLYLLYQMAKKIFLRNTASLVTLHSEVVDQTTLNALFSLSDYFMQLEKDKDDVCCIRLEKSMSGIDTPLLRYRITNEGIRPFTLRSSRTRV